MKNVPNLDNLDCIDAWRENNQYPYCKHDHYMWVKFLYKRESDVLKFCYHTSTWRKLSFYNTDDGYLDVFSSRRVVL